MVGWSLFASEINGSISSLFCVPQGNTSSMYLFHSRGFILLLLIVSVSTMNIKMLAKATATLVPFAVP